MTGREIKIPLDLFSSEISIDLALNEDEYAHKLQHKLQAAFNHVQQYREYAVNKAKIRHNRTCTAANFTIGDYVWRTVKSSLKSSSKALQNKREGPYVILNRFGETTYEVKHLYKLRAKRETVHRDRLTKCHMRKLNFDHPNSPSITTHTSNNDPQTNSTSPSQPKASQSQPSTTIQTVKSPTHSQDNHPITTQQLTATAHKHRGRLKGSKNKIQAQSLINSRTFIPMSEENDQTVRRSTRIMNTQLHHQLF
jgi:hypothetical protein